VVDDALMTRVGLQLGVERARAVVVTGWPRRRSQAVEVPFDPERPDEAVDALRPLVGKARRIAVAIDVHLLRTKRVTLPALSAAQRRSVLQLEPERFFAVRGEEIVPAVRADDGLVFAVPATALARWVAAIERIAPVEVVEPTPVALARALATGLIRDALVFFDGGSAGIGVAEILEGRVMRARRLFGTGPQMADSLRADGIPAPGLAVAYLDPSSDERRAALAALSPSTPLEPLPTLGGGSRGGGITGPFAAAYGAVLAMDNPLPVAETLLSPAHGAAIRRRRMRERGAAIACCVVAFVLAVLSLDNRQDRVLRGLESATATLSSRAAPALAMQTELANLGRRAGSLRAIDIEHPGPLRVVRALSAVMPSGAFVRQIHVDGADWQVDGYAPNASAVLAALGANAEFRDVHFLSATNQTRLANRTYESFALAFRFAPTS
jgi:hypothetical protein